MTDIVEIIEHQLDEFDSGKAIHFDYSGLRALITEIRRLREVAEAAEKDRDSALAISRKTHDQWSAADRECATLSARLAKASKALQPFATKAELWLSSVPDHETLWITLGIAGMEEKDEQITLGDLRRAAAWASDRGRAARAGRGGRVRRASRCQS